MLYPIILTIILFFVGLGLRTVLKNLCALCFAFAGTWVMLLLADLFFGLSIDPLILGIYMGGSAVGFMYYLSSRVPQRFSVLKLPFLVSLVFIIHSFLKSGLNKPTILTVALLWAVFLSIFAFRNFTFLKSLARKIAECCRDW